MEKLKDVECPVTSNKNPFRTKRELSEEQRKAAAERLRKIRGNK